MRQLSHSSLHPGHPHVQRALLRSLRLTQRVRVDSDAMERLEPLGSSWLCRFFWVQTEANKKQCVREFRAVCIFIHVLWLECTICMHCMYACVSACVVSVWWGLASWSHCCRRFWLTWMAWRLKKNWMQAGIISQHTFVESCDISWKFDLSLSFTYYSFHYDCIVWREIIPFPADWIWAIKPRSESIGKRRGRRCHRCPHLCK